MKHRPRPTHWDNVADWYDALVGEHGSEYHQKVILPGVLRLLQTGKEKRRLLAGLRVLDLACGQGVACRAFAEQGAKVLGIDAAPALIDAARRREAAEPLGISYHVADATKLHPLPPAIPPASFDAVTIILAAQNFTPLSPVWQAVHAALIPGGHLLLVMMHPCFRVFQQSGWHWDDATHTQSRRIHQYLSSFKTQIQMHPGAAATEATVSFHRPLQAYINTLANANLLLDHLEEWPSHRQPPAGVRFDALEKSRREIPLFLALRARKI